MKVPYLPPDLSTHGAPMDMLLAWLHVLMLILFFGWGTYFVVVLFKFRAGRVDKADHHGVRSHFSSYIEAIVVLVEVVLLLGLALPLWATWVETGQDLDNPDAVKVRVIAQQFAWNVQYAGPDGKFGRLRSDLIDESTNTLGLDPDDPNGKDDIVALNRLLIPKGKPVRVQISSKDVIHSFFIPVLRVKQDAVPGQSIPVGFEATMTSKEFREKEVAERPDYYRRKMAKLLFEDADEGKYASVDDVLAKFGTDLAKYPDLTKAVPDFEIACAQLCGAQHYKMVGFLHILDDAEWATVQTTAGLNKWVGDHLRWGYTLEP